MPTNPGNWFGFESPVGHGLKRAMRRRLIIHPGWGKTGTSAIQQHFADHYNEYCEYGILYPKSGRFIDSAHHAFALAASPREDIPCPHSFEEIEQGINDEILEYTPNTVIISSELSPIYFQNPHMDYFFSVFEDIDVIFTVRPQSQIISSIYKHVLKTPEFLTYDGIYKYFSDNIDQFDFMKGSIAWNSSRIRSRRALAYSNTGLFEQFCATANIPCLGADERRVNESISDFTAQILEETMPARAALEPEQRALFVSGCIAACDVIPVRGDILPAPARAAIEAIFRASNLAFCAEYGVDPAHLNTSLPLRTSPLVVEQQAAIRPPESTVHTPALLRRSSGGGEDPA